MKKYEINHYEIQLKNECIEDASILGKSPVKLVMLSDLHNNAYGINVEKLLLDIEKEHPDFVVIAGDMYIGDSRCKNLVADDFLTKLASKYPVYYGMGNHEYRTMVYPDKFPGIYEQFQRMIERTGIHLLQNETCELEIKGCRIAIDGLMIDHSFYKKFKRTKMENGYVQKLMGTAKEKYYNILLAHHPNYFKEYASWGADLVFAGHVHGGMARIPLIGGVIAPNYRLFPKYDKGLYQEGNAKMLLSAGIGTHTIPLRPFNPPEMVVVTLKIAP